MEDSLRMQIAKLQAVEDIRKLKARYAAVCDNGYPPEDMAPLFVSDAVLDARNAFATTKPQDRKHIVEGTVSGPLGSSGKTSFLLSGHDQVEDQQAFVFAAGLTGPMQDVAPQPLFVQPGPEGGTS